MKNVAGESDAERIERACQEDGEAVIRSLTEWGYWHEHLSNFPLMPCLFEQTALLGQSLRNNGYKGEDPLYLRIADGTGYLADVLVVQDRCPLSAEDLKAILHEYGENGEKGAYPATTGEMAG